MTALITTADRDGVRIVTLNRPERRNALTPDMLDGLREAVAATTTTRCMLLRGEGAAFCSGFDLSLCEADPDGHTMRRLLASLSGVVRTLRSLSIPMVAAAHGGAIAGGCALLGGADVVVADRRAKLGYPVVRLGVSPGVSGATLARYVTWGVARRLMLDPTLIDGAEAHRLGLVHLLVDQALEVEARAMSLATELASKPPEAMAATKQWMHEIEDALLGRLDRGADAALAASLGLVGGDEERRMLRAPVRAK